MVVAVGYPYVDALAALSDLVQAGVEPTLSDAELGRLLARHAAVTDESGNLPDAWPAWGASTAYPVNYRVVPATRNGYVYKVITAGTSGSSTPTWATTVGADVTDGSVVWDTEAAAPWVPTYSPAGLNAAAAAGWETKAAKLGAGETFSADGASFNPQERRKFCLDMAARFRRSVAGSFRVTGRTSRVENWQSTESLAVNG